MTAFYTTVFGLQLTDQGVGKNFKYDLRFLSGSSEQHHQLVLASGREPGTPSSIMQMSFKVQSLDIFGEFATARFSMAHRPSVA